jgi:class 3 adenylate cyclase
LPHGYISSFVNFGFDLALSEIRYAKSGDVHVAYQSIGQGPVDLIVGLPAFVTIAAIWEDPLNAQFFQELGSFTRLAIFDKRGVGLSDRDVGIPTLEERMDDYKAVLDATESKKAVLLGISDSAPMSLLFAAAHPDRTLGLILIGGMARILRAPDYPWGITREDFEEEIKSDESEWGKDSYVESVARELAPSRAEDPKFKRWLAREMLLGASPSSAAAIGRMNMQVDVRSVLQSIHVPTLVLAGKTRTDIQEGKYIAENVPGARFSELPAREHFYLPNEATLEAEINAIREFVKTFPAPSEPERFLTTVLLTDIVDSTKRASELGDSAWGRLLEQYYQTARKDLVRFHGRLIKTIGDGFLAIFDGPTRAARFACELRDQARVMGLQTRAGLHSGECVMTEGDIQGIAVHIASRVCGMAHEGEVFASGTVRDLSVGSDVPFRDRGEHALKGLEGVWRVYSVESS